jgi:hypothetical protein
MNWKETNEHGEVTFEANNFYLIRWEKYYKPGTWRLYKGKGNWNSETKIIELPYETSTKEAKRLATEAILDKLSNNELREMEGK